MSISKRYPKGRFLDPATIASAIVRSREDLHDRRRRLARVATPGNADLIVAREFAWARRLLDARRRSLLRIDGVVGCGLAHKRTGGIDTGRPSIVIYVRWKWDPDKPPPKASKSIPRRFRSGKKTIETDVVELGPLELHATVFPGFSIGPDATHLGAKLRGTLGTYARDAVTGTTVAITAMHVMGIDEFPIDTPGPQPQVFAPSLADSGPASFFGSLVLGSRTGIDAAKISVSNPSVSNTIPAIGEIGGWRPTTFPGDVGVPVRMYGTTSKFQPGQIHTPAVYLPDYGLDSAILVLIDSAAGDSGAPLVDSSNLLLGFLVGAAPNGLRVFCPAGLVFSRLSCNL